MNTEKVVLPKDVAERLEYLRIDNSDERIISVLFDPNNGYSYAAEAVNEYDRVEIVRALLCGYTVEKSPEDKVAEYYRDYCSYDGTTLFTEGLFEGRRQGVVETLDILGIEIEGVNVEDTF